MWLEEIIAYATAVHEFTNCLEPYSFMAVGMFVTQFVHSLNGPIQIFYKVAVVTTFMIRTCEGKDCALA